MKKILFSFALLMGIVMSASAQQTIQTSKMFDNISVGVTAGATTNLPFNSVFPLNAVAGLRVQKDFTPVFGFQVEGSALLGDNNGGFVHPYHTFVKGTNVGLNGAINLHNWIGGYNGQPRFFEASLIGGFGWLYEISSYVNYLTTKTGFDLAFNINDKSSLVLTPAIYWNLKKEGNIQFSKRYADLSIAVSYVYHFKNSNGTRSFKSYDVGAMMEEINRLNHELAAAQSRLVKPIPHPHRPHVVVKDSIIQGEYVVQFAKNSSELSPNSCSILDKVPFNYAISVVAYSSPEGSESYNQKLSEMRAAVVKDYLIKRGAKNVTADGKGVFFGAETNRIAIVTLE